MILSLNNWPRPIQIRSAFLAVMALVAVLAIACTNTPAPTPVPATPTSVPAASPEQPAPSPTTEPASQPEPEQKLNVVTTSSILADWVKNVGGNRVEVFSLVPVGADPHSYQPGARDVTRVADAEVIFKVGLTLEGSWLDNLVRNAAVEESRIIALGEFVDPIESMDEHGHDDDDHHSLLRLLVADHNDAVLHVIDAGSGDVIATFPVSSPARVYASPSGRYGIVTQPDANIISFVDGGVWIEDHDDHHHDIVEDPHLLPFSIQGGRPADFAAHQGQIAIFLDHDGAAAVISENQLESSNPLFHIVNTAGPHHGVTIPMGNHVIISTLDPATDTSPSVVSVYDLSGQLVSTFPDCARAHGAAASGNMAAIGCADGVLIVERSGDAFNSRKVLSPPGSPADGRISAVLGHDDLPFFIGNFGRDAINRIDPVTGTITTISLPADRWAFALDADGEHLLVLTMDGFLHLFEADEDHPEDSIQVMPPFTVPSGQAGPALVVGHGVAFITNPQISEIIEVHFDHDLEIEGRRSIPGTPGRMALLGVLDDDDHDHGHNDHDHGHNDHGHAHNDDHDHDHGPDDPHFWFDPVRVKVAVNEIAEHLAALDPSGAATYRANAEEYNRELDELHSWIQAQVNTIPAERKLMITSHDSFQYLAERYGFRILGTIIPGLTTEVEPSAVQLAALVDTIREHNVPAVFAETVVSDRLARTIADEAGARVISTLYSESLGPDGSGAETYIGMMRANIETILEALR